MSHQPRRDTTPERQGEHWIWSGLRCDRNLLHSSGSSPPATHICIQGPEPFATSEAFQREVIAMENGRDALGSARNQPGSNWPGLQNTQQPPPAASFSLGYCPNHRVWEPSWHSPALFQESFCLPICKACVGRWQRQQCCGSCPLPSFSTLPRTFECFSQLQAASPLKFSRVSLEETVEEGRDLINFPSTEKATG